MSTIDNLELRMIEVIKRFIRPTVDLGRKIRKLNKLKLIPTVVRRDQISVKIGIDQGREQMLDQG
jgi:hypothetical protein